VTTTLQLINIIIIIIIIINHLTPNGHYMGRTAQLTPRCSILYTGCPRRNVKYFGRVFLESNYTDITQNTYVYPKLHSYGDNGQRSLKL